MFNVDAIRRCIESFERAFSTSDDLSLNDGIEQFRILSPSDRIACWRYLTRDGINRLDFAKFVHRHLVVFVMDIFNVEPKQVDELVKQHNDPTWQSSEQELHQKLGV